MSLSTATTLAGSARPRKPRSMFGSKPRNPGHRQASGSEEELAKRQQRRNANSKTPCCVICSLTSLTLYSTMILFACCLDVISHDHWT